MSWSLGSGQADGPAPGFQRPAHGLERIAPVAPGPGRVRRIALKAELAVLAARAELDVDRLFCVTIWVPRFGTFVPNLGGYESQLTSRLSLDPLSPLTSANSANPALRSMTSPPPRVAYFPDSFHEVNGVAHTSRHFEAFARRRNLPFLCVRAGDRAQASHRRRQRLDARTAARLSLLCARKGPPLRSRVSAPHSAHRRSAGALQARPDSHHRPQRSGHAGRGPGRITSSLPLAASWHTNVHEYAARRSDWFLRLLPERQSAKPPARPSKT